MTRVRFPGSANGIFRSDLAAAQHGAHRVALLVVHDAEFDRHAAHTLERLDGGRDAVGEFGAHRAAGHGQQHAHRDVTVVGDRDVVDHAERR